jgi:transposase
MAAERLSMRKTREILRHRWELRCSYREIKRALGVALATVSDTIARATAAHLDWATVTELSDDEIEGRLYPKAPDGTERPLADPATLDLELRKAGVTLRLLHVEYLERNPVGAYGYTQFCEQYRAWKLTQRVTMRQVHRAGDKLFVDYSGKKPCIVDPETGARIEVELFVAVLGASNYTYVEATRTQKVADWVMSHVRALEYFGGAPCAIVPDQLRSAVTRPCRYEPGVQRTYDELGRHYDTVIFPARPAHPRDKAKAEVGVQVAQRWILARLRNQTFFSLEELNERIAELLEDLNTRVMVRYKASRRDLFERLERAVLKPMPTDRFSYGEWKKATVNIDYHVVFDDHFYSAPYQMVGDEVWIRATALTIEIFRNDSVPTDDNRVGSHLRSYKRGGHTTSDAHRSVLHLKHAEWTPERIINWAKTIGENTARLVEKILAERKHPEHGFRSCLGIIRLDKKYGRDRLEAACARALAVGGRSYGHVNAILQNGLDRAALPRDAEPSTPIDHENVRGPDYYN